MTTTTTSDIIWIFITSFVLIKVAAASRPTRAVGRRAGRGGFSCFRARRFRRHAATVFLTVVRSLASFQSLRDDFIRLCLFSSLAPFLSISSVFFVVLLSLFPSLSVSPF